MTACPSGPVQGGPLRAELVGWLLLQWTLSQASPAPPSELRTSCIRAAIPKDCMGSGQWWGLELRKTSGNTQEGPPVGTVPGARESLLGSEPQNFSFGKPKSPRSASTQWRFSVLALWADKRGRTGAGIWDRAPLIGLGGPVLLQPTTLVHV